MFQIILLLKIKGSLKKYHLAIVTFVDQTITILGFTFFSDCFHPSHANKLVQADYSVTDVIQNHIIRVVQAGKFKFETG